jgi:cyanophycinase
MKFPVFLIGGGWRVETFSQTYARFLKSAGGGEQRRIAIVVAEEPDADSRAQFERFREAFGTVGLKPDESFETIVSAAAPLTRETLTALEATGVFVCGGLTPAFYDALCVDRAWLEYLSEKNVPYCGFSAGAAIAAADAIVGGWRRKIGARIVDAANENAGEDLELLDVRPGLAIVPFAVDVHATQWGTLSRLVHVVDARLAPEGYAIDENTMMEVTGGEIKVFGAGSAYSVRRTKKGISIEVLRSVSKDF